ncbi:hypothetical protein ACIBMZ_26470 [Micromonospora sp. NPDC049900]|uniref:hypothetical protein n=1 Tax=Micromonospora sp. NPDC049900 TaxID=3364275 RepID=UPI00379E8EBC
MRGGAGTTGGTGGTPGACEPGTARGCGTADAGGAEAGGAEAGGAEAGGAEAGADGAAAPSPNGDVDWRKDPAAVEASCGFQAVDSTASEIVGSFRTPCVGVGAGSGWRGAGTAGCGAGAASPRYSRAVRTAG